MSQIAESSQRDKLACQKPAHGRFYFFHICQFSFFTQGKDDTQGRKGTNHVQECKAGIFQVNIKGGSYEV